MLILNNVTKKAKDRHINIIEKYDPDYNKITIDGIKFSDYEVLWHESLKDLKALKKINSEYYLNQQLKMAKKFLQKELKAQCLTSTLVLIHL